MEHAEDLLFVYGTLRKGATRGGFAARLEQQAKWLGPAKTRGRLYQVNPDYPGMVESETAEEWVAGEIWQFSDKELWQALDNYEGTEYVRERRPVWLADGTQHSAWVYLYASRITTAMAIVAV